MKFELIKKLDNKDNLSEAALWDASSNKEIDAKMGLLDKIKNVFSSGNKELEVSREALDAKSKSDSVGVLATKDEDIRSLRELITYGLKGMSAYLKHANELNYDDEAVNAFMQSTLAKLLDDN